MGRRILTTSVGGNFEKQLITSRFVDKLRNVSTITEARSDGTAVATFKRGPYTYKGFYIRVRSKVEIVGKTVATSGKHYVKTANLAEYVGKVRLEIDNEVERELSTDRMVQFNAKDGYDVQDGVLYMAFGGPFQFDDQGVEDVYQLGTKNLRSLEVTFDLTSDWDNANMFLEVVADYTSVARPLSFIQTVKTFIHQPSAVGEYTIDSLPTHSDIAAIYVLGSDLNSAKLIVDDQEVFNCDAHILAASNKMHGVNVDALGDGMVFDFLKDKDIRKGLRSLETAAQRKRGADLQIICDMAAGSELTVIVDQIGRYKQQG
jgi:hypothetical protein